MSQSTNSLPGLLAALYCVQREEEGRRNSVASADAAMAGSNKASRKRRPITRP